MYNVKVNLKHHVQVILAETGLLVFALMAIGTAMAVLWHAFLGVPLSYGATVAGARFVEISAPANVPAIRSIMTNGKKENYADKVRGGMTTAGAETLPEKVLIDVPFTVQAPFGDWSQPFADACEEASVVMAYAWAKKIPLDAATAEREILAQVDFENANFGYNRDTAIEETAKILLLHYKYPNVKVVYDISIGDIKRELAAGNIVIVPAAGKLLNNPNFVTSPNYHMLVVRGYDDAKGKFITNEPGTLKGDGYLYSYEVIENAIHDFPGTGEDILRGPKGMIVVSPEQTKRP